MINRDRRGHSYCGVRGEILGSPQDEQLRKHLSNVFINQERKLEKVQKLILSIKKIYFLNT
jgi:hypothetical protein